MTDILKIIYSLALLAVGMCIGAVLVSMADNKSFVRVVEKNRKLREQNIALKDSLNSHYGINNGYIQKSQEVCKIEKIVDGSDFKIGNFESARKTWPFMREKDKNCALYFTTRSFWQLYLSLSFFVIYEVFNG